MLRKDFYSDVIYEVTIYRFKNGRESDPLTISVLHFATLEEAQRHIEKYHGNLYFASATIEINKLDRKVNKDEFKKGRYEIVKYKEVCNYTSDDYEELDDDWHYMSSTSDDTDANKHAAAIEELAKDCGFSSYKVNYLKKIISYQSPANPLNVEKVKRRKSVRRQLLNALKGWAPEGRVYLGLLDNHGGAIVSNLSNNLDTLINKLIACKCSCFIGLDASHQSALGVTIDPLTATSLIAKDVSGNTIYLCYPFRLLYLVPKLKATGMRLIIKWSWQLE